MSIDVYLDRQRSHGYDCAAFAREVWLGLTGIDAAETASGLLSAQFDRKIARTTRTGFTEIAAPVDPCFVIMRRPRSSLHVGIYIRGKVLHLCSTGVEYQRLDIASQQFKRVQFAIC